MKATLILAAALAFASSAALAQTVAPGTTPGAQTGNPSNMPSAGSPTAAEQNMNSSSRMNGMSGSDKRAMRKSKKMKSNDNGMKMKTKM